MQTIELQTFWEGSFGPAIDLQPVCQLVLRINPAHPGIRIAEHRVMSEHIDRSITFLAAINRFFNKLPIVAGFIRDQDDHQFSLLPNSASLIFTDRRHDRGTGIFFSALVDLDVIDRLPDFVDVRSWLLSQFCDPFAKADNGCQQDFVRSFQLGIMLLNKP